MKKSKILAPALGVLVLSTAASISGTVAWFTANNSVAVTGMSVKTRVGSNLLIADISTANASDDLYGSDLTQTKTGLYLEPVSTINGSSFFYHESDGIHGDGSQSNNKFVAYNENGRVGHQVADAAGLAALTGMATGDIAYVADPGEYKEYDGSDWQDHDLDFGDDEKTMIDVAFNANYSFNHLNEANSCFGYVDYTFYLRAFSSAANQVLRMTECNLLRGGATINSTGDYAWRVAVLSAPVNEGAANPTSSMALKSILMHTSGDYFTDGKAAATAGNPGTIDTVSELGTAPTIATALAANSTTRYKVTVRLWLEGEDESCNNNTYASLSESNWTLDVAFELGANPTGVTTIDSVA